MPTCAQTTKDGHKCTRTCKKGSKYCWQHQATFKKSPKRRSTHKKYVRKTPENTGKTPEELQKSYCKCVISIKKKQPNVNAFAICTKSVGRISNSCKQYEK